MAANVAWTIKRDRLGRDDRRAADARGSRDRLGRDDRRAADARGSLALLPQILDELERRCERLEAAIAALDDRDVAERAESAA